MTDGMANEIERAEAAIVEAIRVRELELDNLKQALIRVQSGLAAKPGALAHTSEFAACGITAGTERLLAEHGELRTREIADRLLAGGIQTRSKHFVATVHATLRNAPRRFRYRHANDRQLLWSSTGETGSHRRE